MGVDDFVQIVYISKLNFLYLSERIDYLKQIKIIKTKTYNSFEFLNLDIINQSKIDCQNRIN